METLNNLEVMKNAINQAESGSVFIASDFSDIASNDVVRKNLSLLTKRNIINRISHGIYIRTEYSKLTNEPIPFDMDKVATAIARNYGWKVIPSGQTALNILGLSNQVTVTYEYLSNGPYRTYEIDGYELKFKHSANKNINNLSFKTALIISAIRSLGETNVSNKHIEILKTKLTSDEKKNLLKETKYITRWIRLMLEVIVEN